jgi:hypothetical protein
MTECLALDLAKLSPRLARLIEVKAREWGCSPEVAAMRLLDQAASSATQPQQAADGADSHLPPSHFTPAHTLTSEP